MTAVVKAESLTKRFGEVRAVTDCHWLRRLGRSRAFSGPMALTRRRRCGWSWAGGADERRRALRGYGCIAEPGTGWIMPKVLPSVSLA